MKEEMRAGEVQNLNDLKEQKQEILNVISEREKAIQDLRKRVADLEIANKEDTKLLINDLEAQIQKSQKIIKTSQEEIERLNKVIEDTSAKLAYYSQVMGSQMTP